ncbi:MAG: hypothetical protein MUP27_09150 [Desulfobacterales bacterium]|nr:hypothetical protein [Desulfobacterales bacterium]
MKEMFKEKNFRGEANDLIVLCDEIISEYLGQGLRLTLRQLYYQFVSRDSFPENRKWSWDGARWVRDPNGTKNAEPNYKWLGTVLSEARLAGLLDWEAIEDRIRVPSIPSEWKNLRDIIDSVLYSYRLPRWEGQPYYIELWVEKDALAGILRPLTNQYHVTMMVNRGYSSQSAMYEASKRFLKYAGERELILFYLCDFDPSGEDMVRDISDRLDMFGVSVDVRKIALTLAQVKKYNPPPNPAKIKDPRAAEFISRYGASSWEVDAINPKELRGIIVKSIEGCVDKDLMRHILDQENSDKIKLTHAVDEIMNG